MILSFETKFDWGLFVIGFALPIEGLLRTMPDFPS